MNITAETIITEEVMETETLKNAVAIIDDSLTTLADLIGELLAIKQSMVGKTIGEVEQELDAWGDKLSRVYWQM